MVIKACSKYSFERPIKIKLDRETFYVKVRLSLKHFIELKNVLGKICKKQWVPL